MQTLNLVQGSPEWLAHRRTSFNASDAPAMMGCSPYKTRTALLHELHTGISPEHDAATERRFADGHRFEALARPLAQDIVGEELYPVTGTVHAFELSRQLSASFDGLTLLGDMGFEHKSLNDELRAIQHFVGQQLPLHYRVQMEHQMLVSGADKILFMASKWAGDELVEERHCWYTSDAALRAEILAGWKQFDADLKTYVPPTAAVEKVIAEPVEQLPAPVVQVTGQIALQDNFKVFEARLRDFLDNKLIREPKTDQDFADLDGQIKAMKQARESLKAAEAQMLAQVQPVDQAKKTKDMLDSLLQQNVSMAEKLLTAEKDRRKLEIVNGATIALRQHIDKLNTRFERSYLAYSEVPADFGGVIRGLKSLASMEDKVATELARCKIGANALADRIDANLKAIKESGLVVHDTAQLVLKSPEDLANVLTVRKTAEENRLEAERERIRKEEQERADREARDRLAAEQAAQTQITSERGLQQVLKAEAATPDATDRSTPATASPSVGSMGAGQPADAAPAGNVVPLSRPAPPPVDTGARINLSDIKDRLHPIQITDEGLASLGFSHVATEKAAKLYRAADFGLICAALVRHIEAVQAKAAA